MGKILIVDDERRIRSILGIMLQSLGHETEQAEDGVEAIEKLENQGFDLVISDIRMDNMDGKALLKSIKEKHLGLPVIFITAYASVESSVEALRLGAADYIVKPFEEEQIQVAVERALGMGKILSENIMLKKSLEQGEKKVQKVFHSSSMKKVETMIKKVSQTDATVLVTGESGVGKEVVSRMIHDNSNRKNERFVPVNCASISKNLMESELFGYEKGAFTGAEKRARGKFEFADKGTLFLDEVGELPFEAQAKLLRVLQEKKILRVGGNREIDVDARLICATNKNLEHCVAAGTFREDLFYRLQVFPIEVPPLRERKEDLVPLALIFLEKHAGQWQESRGGEVLTPAAVKRLKAYHWPGNVRELSNTMERIMILKSGKLPVNADDLGFLSVSSQKRQDNGEAFELPAEGIDYETLRKSLVKQALDRTGGNKSSAARLLNLTRSKFRTLARFGDSEGS